MKQKFAHKIVIFFILVALVFTLGVQPARAGMDSLSEDFNSPLSGWKMLGKEYPADLNTGWLRLTSASQDQAGVAFYNTAYSTAGNVFDIRFDFASYDGSGNDAADGLAFFMLDGSVTPTAPGGMGGGLGYKGISGGIFGVGFDEYGPFGDQPALTDDVAIRGATSAGNPLVVSVVTEIQTHGGQPTTRNNKHSVRITVANNKVSVWMNGNLLIYEQGLFSPLPATVKFGFSGSTGANFNIHEVDNLQVDVTPSVLYVKQDGYTDWPCGQDWFSACTLQTALRGAAPGQEIRVKAGVYKPAAVDRAATFQLVQGVAMYGGFSGDETTRDQRHADLYAATILSGDINTVGSTSDNAYHVVTGATGATLDGFAVTGGNANGADSINIRGGGMYNYGVSPTVTNVTFSGNGALLDGGGMYNYGASPTLTNVTFANNTAWNGGGMYNINVSNPTVANSTFTSNRARDDGTGGGMFNFESNPRIVNTTFSNNNASKGGGMYNTNTSNPTVASTTFSGNEAALDGGGMYNNSSRPTVANATFSGNKAAWGAGMYNTNNSNPTVTNVTFNGNAARDNGGGLYNSGSNPILRNVILWGDTVNEIYGTATVSYSVVQGGYGGTGNISTDPKLGTLGNYGGFTQNFPLLNGSSAIDKGNNLYCAYPPVSNLDQRGVTRPQGTGCDIGAVERNGAEAYYVKPNATGTCASWQNACSLQTALRLAGDGSEVWVMKGIYKPTTGTDRAVLFQLATGVEVYGGFAGTETARDQRNPKTNVTILSGDIGTVDDNSDNSYHVVTGATNATLDGFTVSGGNANASGTDDSQKRGGGMFNFNSSPTVTNVIFSGNSASLDGGGMYNDNGSHPTVTNVTFERNTAIYGGGMYNSYSHSKVSNVTFSDNTASDSGGGMFNNHSHPTVTDVTFSGNKAARGGGICNNWSSAPTITNVTFSGNVADLDGGGIYNTNTSNPTVTNATFSGNQAAWGGGMYNTNNSNPTVTNVTFNGNTARDNGGGMFNSGSNPTLRNVILWGDTVNEIYGTATVSYSVVQGASEYSGTGNKNTDPMLGPLGNYGGFTQTFPLLAGSSAVDAGDDTVSICDANTVDNDNFDQNGVARPSDLHCDIGAYELDLKQTERKARAKLKAAMELRAALSPYQGNDDFETYVANFDYATGLNRNYQGATLLEQINQADKDLRLARELYGFLIAYNPNFRSDSYYTGNPPVGYTEPLCRAGTSKEDPNPPDPTHIGQVLDPVIDWCDFPARLRQSVREAAYLHMIFGQQFMTDALGLQFSGTALLGADAAVRQEAARLEAAKYQYAQAEMMLNESLKIKLGNDCYVADYFEQSEWSLFSRAIEGQETAQHQLAVRLSYLDVPQSPTGPQQSREKAVKALRIASTEGYIKLIGAAGQSTTSRCVIDGKPVGERPDGELAGEMADNLAETHRKANDMTAGRNIFGFDVTFTPARPYTGGVCGSASAGLYQDAVCAAQLTQQLQDAEANAERDYNNSQAALRAEVQNVQNGIDNQIAEKSGCEAPDWECVSKQKELLNKCLLSVGVYPATADADFDACINDTDINNSAAKRALLDLRSIYIQQYSIYKKAENINSRIKNSNDANKQVTGWLIASGVMETLARTSQAGLDMISCAMGDQSTIGDAKDKPCWGVGLVNMALQVSAGSVSTRADVKIEDAENEKETKNLLLDMSELLIDAYTASQQFASKYAEYESLLDSLDEDVIEAQRQRAYFASSPANDPSYRIVLDSTRLQFANQLDLASKLTYLAARRAEYEYGARLNASNIRISDIYRARTAGDLLTFLSRLNSVTSNLPAGIPSNLSVRDLTYSVKQNLATDEQPFSTWVTDHTQGGVLKFTLNTATLKDDGLIANLIPQGYDGYWLITIGGIGSPKPTSNGLSVNLVSNETGLGYRAVRVTQGGVLHLRSQAGCDFDYLLIAPASLLGLDWPANQFADVATASFLANVNGIDYAMNGLRTDAFQGRALASTDWTVEIFLGPPAPGMKAMDLSQLTDIELNFSIVYASRTPGVPVPDACTRIDW